MDKNELFEIIDQLKELVSTENLLDAICMCVPSQTLEDALRFIDVYYETNLFDN